MKQVFEQYASAIISVLMASTILFLIIGGSFGQRQGLGQVLGQVLGYSVKESNISENEAFDEYMEEDAPTITQQRNFIIQNERTPLADCFKAVSCKNESLSVYLRKAWTLGGEETDLGISADGTSICASEPGVYWVQVYARNSNQKETCVLVKLLVNER